MNSESGPHRFTPIAMAIAVAMAFILAVIAASCADTADTTSVEPSSGGLQRGAEIYASSCASCHGAELEGTDKGPPQRSMVYEPNHHPDASYESAIANGAPQHHWNFGDMPAVEGVTGDDITNVIAFIRAEQERRGFEPYPPN